MAGMPVREEVRDANAALAQQSAGVPSVPLAGVGSPATGRNSGVDQAMAGIQSAFAGIQSGLEQIQNTQNQKAVTEGNMAYIQGAVSPNPETDKYRARGYESTSQHVNASTWAVETTSKIGKGLEQLDPASFAEQVKGEIRANTKDIKDPVVLQQATQAWTQAMVPVLLEHRKAHDGYMTQQEANALSRRLETGNFTAPDALHKGPQGLPVSEAVVSPVYKPIDAERDRDIGIRTMLGEAYGMGAEGMAAVGQVLKNRALSHGRFGGSSIAEVALQDKQFSAWNDKENGGNDLVRMSSDSDAYKKAGEIYDTVMAGKTPDLTGGATHFYNNKQMKNKPAWWDDEVTRAGGKSIQVGEHLFAGGRNSSLITDRTQVPAKLDLVPGSAPRLDGVDTKLTDSIAIAAQNLPEGYEVKVKSGKRSEDGDRKGSAHYVGGALDVTLYKNGKPLKDYQDPSTFREYEKFAQTVKAVQEQKFPDMKSLRWGGYFSGGKDKYGALDLMHFDTDPNGHGMGGGTWETGLSAEQRGLWAGAESVGRNSIQPMKIAADTPQQSTLRHTLMSSSLPDSVKAAAAADAIRRGYQKNDGTVYAALGGIDTLYQLGANPSTIDEVLRAKTLFDNKESATSIIENEQKLAKIRDYKALGNSTTAGAAALVASMWKDDTIGREYIKRAMQLVTATPDDPDSALLVQPENADRLANILYSVQNGAPAKEAMERIRNSMESMGVKNVDKASASWVQQISAAHGGFMNKQVEELKKAEKQGYETNRIKNAVAVAIKSGGGGAAISGTLHIVNASGAVQEVQAKKYFVDEVHKQALADYDTMLSDKKSAGASAQELALAEQSRAETVFTQELKTLYKHDVIDDATSAQWTSMLRNPIVRDGKVNPEAVQLMGIMARAHADGVPDEYINKVLGGRDDPRAGTIWEYVKENYDGTMRMEEVLKNAEEAVDKPDVQPLTQAQINAGIPKTGELLEKLGGEDTSGFWRSLLNGPLAESKVDTDRLRDMVVQRANQIHKYSPGVDVGTVMKRAAADVANSAMPFSTGRVRYSVTNRGDKDTVGPAWQGSIQPVQNIFFGNPLSSNGQLDKLLAEPVKMQTRDGKAVNAPGLIKQDVGPAITKYIEHLSSKEQLFLYNDNGKVRRLTYDEMRTNKIGNSTLAGGYNSWLPTTEYYPKTEFNSRTGTFSMTLYSDKELTKPTPFTPHVFTPNDVKLVWAQANKPAKDSLKVGVYEKWAEVVDGAAEASVVSGKGLQELFNYVKGKF